jgi:hypothetical protein
MSNEKISALSTVTNGQGSIPDIRNLSAIPGVEGAGNAKISGEELVASIINQGSAAQGRVCFYGAGAGGQTSIGGSSGFSWDQSTDTLNIGTPNSAAGLEADVKLHGTYVSGSDQPKLTFVGGNSVAGSFEFKFTTSTNGAAQTWILPQTLPSTNQLLRASAISTNDVTLDWVTEGADKAFVALTGATPTWTIRDNYNATWTPPAGAVTLNITASAGDSGAIVIDSSNSPTITYPATSQFTGGTAPTLSGGTDVLSFLYDGTNYYWTYGLDFQP